MNQKKQQQSGANFLTNLLFNIIAPTMILTKLSTPDKLGVLNGLLLALAFPLAYGSYDLIKNKEWNYISILGLVSVLLTGGFSLMKLDGIWFAIKEAAIPLLIGISVLLLNKTKYDLVRTMIFNPNVFNIDLIHQKIDETNTTDKFEQLISKTTYIFSSSFFLSATLNFFLAVVILKSPTGTPEFNAELGKMTALSFPVIMLPSMVVLMASIFYLTKGITSITGLKFQEMINEPS